MGRPKVPLIQPDRALAVALELIDRDGLEAFSIRKLGGELGVNGASLYHHFQDKEAILLGVTLLVLREGRVARTPSKTATWQAVITASVLRLRVSLLRHPNVAPLLMPRRIRPFGMMLRDQLLARMEAQGVPVEYGFAIIDSAETLGRGAALLNPWQVSPRERFALKPSDAMPHLTEAIRSGPQTSERLFRLELEALLAGWTTLIRQSQDGETQHRTARAT